MGRPSGRRVILRDEHQGGDHRFLSAWVDGVGALHIAGHDLGPSTAAVSGDGEYEWDTTVAAADIARIIALLGGAPGEDVLGLLERHWTGRASYELERLLSASDIPLERWTWSG